MHDLRSLRDNLDALRDGMARRGKLDVLAPLIDRAEGLDRERRRLTQEVEKLKAKKNSLSQLYARGKPEQAGYAPMDEARQVGEAIAGLDAQLKDVLAELDGILMGLPNITLPDVPAGGEERNQVLRSWGTPREPDGVKPHWEIGEALGILDLARGAKITGSGFVVLRGAGARLTRALMSFMIDMHTQEHGYDEAWVPFMVNRASMTGTGQLPKLEDDMYAVRDDDLFLIPTAEVPLTNLHRDEVLDGASLPVALVGYTPCFRREAGAHGKDTRGMIRVHQFDKVELVRLTAPEQSPAQHEALTRHAEAVLERLALPYRTVLLAAGDTGFASAKTYDLEVWAPGVGRWLEVSSCSTFTDFQARRANIRFRPAGGGKPQFVHTLNGSGLAFPRVIVAILEHYQQPDGTVRVPDALRPYLGADTLR